MISAGTIVAISSAVGPATRMIVRASGPDSAQIASSIWDESLPAPSTAARGSFRFSGLIVPATLYVFRAPHSYTGEDLIEFHIPGSPLLSRMLLDAIVVAGARVAEPGEFTARAYFNGRIDLTEAEGVAATIAAGNEQELRGARQLLSGELARRLQPARDLLIDTLALIEVGIDFSDEDVTFLSAAQVRERIASANEILSRLLEDSTRFERIGHEPHIVLVGRPNAGKSTLLNALAGRERAVTSPIAGTTRDILTTEVPLRRGIVKLSDAAGIEAGADVVDPIQQQMQTNAHRAVESADIIVLVHDATDERPALELPQPVDLVVHTKSDLVPSHRLAALFVSARTGENLEKLKDELNRRAFGESRAGDASLALNARHVSAVSDARDALARAAERIDDGAAELVALELRESLDSIGQVVGLVTPDDVLGRVFSAFCIGK